MAIFSQSAGHKRGQVTKGVKSLLLSKDGLSHVPKQLPHRLIYRCIDRLPILMKTLLKSQE